MVNELACQVGSQGWSNFDLTVAHYTVDYTVFNQPQISIFFTKVQQLKAIWIDYI